MRKLIYILLACATSAQAEITSYAALAEVETELTEIYSNLGGDFSNTNASARLGHIADITESGDTSNLETFIFQFNYYLEDDLFGVNHHSTIPIELENWSSDDNPAYAKLEISGNNAPTEALAIRKVNEILVDVYKVNIAGTLTTTEFYNKFDSNLGASAFNNAIDSLKNIGENLRTIVDNEIVANAPIEDQLDNILEDDWMTTIEGEFENGSTYHQITLETGWQLTFVYLSTLDTYTYSSFNPTTDESTGTQENGTFPSVTAAINHYLAQ